MPAKSAKQYRFMQAIAHGMKPRKTGPSKAVAREFIRRTPKSKFKSLLYKGKFRARKGRRK